MLRPSLLSSRTNNANTVLYLYLYLYLHVGGTYCTNQCLLCTGTYTCTRTCTKDLGRKYFTYYRACTYCTVRVSDRAQYFVMWSQHNGRVKRANSWLQFPGGGNSPLPWYTSAIVMYMYGTGTGTKLTSFFSPDCLNFINSQSLSFWKDNAL